MPYIDPVDTTITPGTPKLVLGDFKFDCIVPERTQGGNPLVRLRTPEPPGLTWTNFWFGVQKDCHAALDAARVPKPNRAMLSGERMEDKVRQRTEFGLIVEPGEVLSEFRWEYKNGVFTKTSTPGFCTLSQDNTYNDTRREGLTPPAEVGLKQIGNQLYLSAKVHHADPTGAKPWIDVQGPLIPLLRGRSYNIAREKLDTHGQPGGAHQVWVDGTLVWDYKGPVGHVGHTGSWPSFGIYRSNAPEELRVRFSKFKSGPPAAMKISW